MDENIIVVSHTATEVDADCAIAALADAGIHAVKQYKNAPGGSTIFAFPSALGFGASDGYDIIVASEAEAKAREILIGAGFSQPNDESVNDTQESTADIIDEPETDESADAEAQPAQNEPASKASALLVILFLAAAALFVIGVDKIIELIKSFF